MTLPPIDAVRYYEWIGRDIEKGKRTFLFGLGCAADLPLSCRIQQTGGGTGAATWMPPGGPTCIFSRRMATIVRIYVWTASIKRGGLCADGRCFLRYAREKSSYGMNKMNSVWGEIQGAVLLYSQRAML